MSSGSVQVDVQEVISRMANRIGELTAQNAMLEATNGALQARVIELESTPEEVDSRTSE